MDTKPGAGGANLDGAPASVDLNDDAFGDEFGNGQFGGEQVPVVEDRRVVRVDGLDSTLLGQMNSGRVPFKLPGDAGLVVEYVDERVAPHRLAGGQPGQSGARLARSTSPAVGRTSSVSRASSSGCSEVTL